MYPQYDGAAGILFWWKGRWLLEK